MANQAEYTSFASRSQDKAISSVVKIIQRSQAKQYIASKIPRTLLESVSQLPLLNVLIIDFPHNASLIPSRTTFPVLHFLHVRISHLPLALQFFNNSSYLSLESLLFQLHCGASLSDDDATSVTKAISSSCVNPSLRQVYVLGSGVTRPASRIHSDALRPFFRFRHMRRIEFRTTWAWDLDDALVRDLANAWPELTELYLDATASWPAKSRITLRGLEPLALHCPLLKDLGIVVDTSAFTHSMMRMMTELGSEAAPEPPLRGKQQSRLQSLAVGSSALPSNAVISVAAYLSGLFSMLAVVEAEVISQDVDSCANVGRWRRVHELLPHFRHARRQERRRIELETS